MIVCSGRKATRHGCCIPSTHNVLYVADKMFTGHVHCTKVWGFEAAFLSSLFALFPSSQQLTGAEYDAGGYVRRGKELATTAQNIGAQEGTSL